MLTQRVGENQNIIVRPGQEYNYAEASIINYINTGDKRWLNKVPDANGSPLAVTAHELFIENYLGVDGNIGNVSKYELITLATVGIASSIPETAGKISKSVSGSLPKNTDKFDFVLKTIKKTGKQPSGYYSGGTFNNRERLLPLKDINGNAITYTEYDVNPFISAKQRGLERLVVGSDGSAWKTVDHYKTFTRIQ